MVIVLRLDLFWLTNSDLLLLVMIQCDVLKLWHTLGQRLDLSLWVNTRDVIINRGRPTQLNIRRVEVDALALVVLLTCSGILTPLLLIHLWLTFIYTYLDYLLYLWLVDLWHSWLRQLKGGLYWKTFLQIVESGVFQSTVANQVIELVTCFENVQVQNILRWNNVLLLKDPDVTVDV